MEIGCRVVKKNMFITASSVLVMLAIGVLSYQYGARNAATQTHDKQKAEGENHLLEGVSEKEISNLGNKIARLQAKIDDLQQQSSDVEANIVGTADVNEDIEAMNARIDALPEQIETEVNLPADSPSAKVLARPKSPSGIPVSVLKDYEKETGVSSEEIEELMRRQE